MLELNNDYSLVSDKIEIKREILSYYQLKITDPYNIPIGNVKKLVPNFVISDSSWKLYLRLRLKQKINTSGIRIHSISMAKTICWIQHKKKNSSRKK